MRLFTIRQSMAGCDGVVTFSVPKGARAESVTMDSMGCGSALFTHENESDELNGECQVLFVWPHSSSSVDVSQSDWRHIGHMFYPNGNWQHVFAASETAKTKRQKRPLDSDAI